MSQAGILPAERAREAKQVLQPPNVYKTAPISKATRHLHATAEAAYTFLVIESMEKVKCGKLSN